MGCEKAASHATAFLGDCGGFAGARAGAVRLPRPDEQVFQAMLDGWPNQQLARNLARSTAEGRESTSLLDFTGMSEAA